MATRAAVEALAVGALGCAAAGWLWRAPGQRAAIVIGAATAWAASSASTAALLWAKSRSTKAFWWAFGGGMGARLVLLGALAVYSVRAPELSQPGLLLSYALGVLAFLLLEYRHIELK